MITSRLFCDRGKRSWACDVAVISDTNMAGPDKPTLTYGLRGISALEVELTGPSHDLHSGVYGGAVVNPITVLTRLLAGLHHPTGQVAVPGFLQKSEEGGGVGKKSGQSLGSSRCGGEASGGKSGPKWGTGDSRPSKELACGRQRRSTELREGIRVLVLRRFCPVKLRPS